MKKFLLVMFCTMFPVLAHGATYYVAKTGSDSNSCTSAKSQSTPKLTINAGTGCLSAGDTLIVKAGTYSEILNDVIPSGTAGNPTIVKSEVQYGAIIQPGAGNAGNRCGSVGLVCFGSRSYITFDGFVTDGTGLSGVYHIYFRDNSGAHDLVVQNNEIRYGADNNSTVNTLGIVDGHAISGITIRGNKIHDMGTGAVAGQGFYSYGMYLHLNNSLVENNEVYNCSGYGLHWYNTVAGDATGNIIRNNRIHDNGLNGGSASDGILFAADGNNNALYNNLIYNNGGMGIHATEYGGGAGPATNNTIYHNTVYHNRSNCIQVGSQGVNTVVRNNICWQNGNDTIVNNGTNTTADHNLLGTNPLFVNAAAADFHLQASSPAIDAGIVMFSGQQYNGSVPDLGALEFGAGGQFPAPINLRLVVN